jgi:FkbM family methyltransferase
LRQSGRHLGNLNNAIPYGRNERSVKPLAGNERHLERLRQAEAMIRQTNVPAARDLLRELVTQSDDLQIRRSAALYIIELFLFEEFRDARAALADEIHEQEAPDPRALRSYAFACFALEDFSESVRVAREALRRQPEDWTAMKTLGMAHLVTMQPTDAFLAFSAGCLLAPNAGLGGFRNLAMRMMQGQRVAAFAVDGQNFQFHLRVDNGQMMEAALHHVHGALTETEELRLIRERVRSSTTLVEVGTLVGNHLVYFLKTLKPKKAIVFDISARSIEACRDNVRLNEPYEIQPELQFRPVGISGKRGTTIGPDGHPADTMSLDEAVHEDVDFLKIDVDGIEIEALNGARQLIKRCRPQIMIEIAREHEGAFRAFVEEIDYHVAANIDRTLYRNYLIKAR